MPFKIGTLADWFGVGPVEGIKMSRKVGAEGVQLYAWNDLNPETMAPGTCRELKKTAEEYSQTVTAICGELGGHGLERPADNVRKIQYLKKCMQLALDLNCSTVTTHLGIVPVDKTLPKYQAMLDACGELSSYAIREGGHFAIETGPERISTLSDFLRECGPGMAINYDPANLVMVTGEDEVEGVRTAGDLIVHTHAKDGICCIRTTAENFYTLFAEGGLEATQDAPYCLEKPLGEGSVRWPEYLKALKETGYRGFLTIEREVKGNAETDIGNAVRFLTEIMEKYNI